MLISEDHKNDLKYIAVRLLGKLTSRTIKELYSKKLISSYEETSNFDLLADIYKSDSLSEVAKQEIVFVIRNRDRIIEASTQYEKKIIEDNIEIISERDELYPEALREYGGMPKVLFARGDTSLLNKIYTNGSAAVVGSRNPGSYSKYATEDVVTKLCKAGVTIVSGMALGIDVCAHKAALRNKGSTIAIMPGGVDVIYPFQNRETYSDILRNGLLLSEMPPQKEIVKSYFASRNRIISGLSDVALIMEAGEHSGTLHTASFAGAQGKDVFVLPNNIYYENAIGGMRLLLDGAIPLLGADEVIESIGSMVGRRMIDKGIYDINSNLYSNDYMDVIRRKHKEDKESLSEDEWELIIHDYLEAKGMDVNALCKITMLGIGKLSYLLSLMESKGVIYIKQGKYFLTR